MCTGMRVNYPQFFSDFLEFSQQIFPEYSNMRFPENSSVGAELFLAGGRMDGQT